MQLAFYCCTHAIVTPGKLSPMVTWARDTEMPACVSDQDSYSENVKTDTNSQSWPCQTHVSGFWLVCNVNQVHVQYLQSTEAHWTVQLGPDRNRPTRWGIFWKLVLTRTPDPNQSTSVNLVHITSSVRCLWSACWCCRHCWRFLAWLASLACLHWSVIVILWYK